METSNSFALPNESAIKKVGKKQYAIVLLAAFGFFLTGILLYFLGYFDKPKAETKYDSLSELTPPVSKNTPLADDKYKDNEENMSNDFENGTEELTSITGKTPRFGKESNERLSDADFNEIEQSRNLTTYSNSIPKSAAQIKKENQNKLFLQHQRKEIAKQKELVNTQTPLYKKTKEELEEEQLDKEDRVLNQRTAQLVLSNLEKAATQSSSTSQIQHSDSKQLPKIDEPTQNSIELHPQIAPKLG